MKKLITLLLLLFLSGCEYDQYPATLHSDEFNQPIKLEGQINTLFGAEDSPFILPDGNTLYLWYTPDISKTPEQQVMDEVTGVYVSYKSNGIWGAKQRIMLQESGLLALDGCLFVNGNEMIFASRREGYDTIRWFRAFKIDGVWKNWQIAEDIEAIAPQVGELHIVNNHVYFEQNGNIYVKNENGVFLIPLINTTDFEYQPYVNADETELWFTRLEQSAPVIYRSKWQDSQWQIPELIVSGFSGEPNLDSMGNLYFTHIYMKDGKKIAADIYVAYKK